MFNQIHPLCSIFITCFRRTAFSAQSKVDVVLEVTVPRDTFTGGCSVLTQACLLYQCIHLAISPSQFPFPVLVRSLFRYCISSKKKPIFLTSKRKLKQPKSLVTLVIAETVRYPGSNNQILLSVITIYG